MNRCDRGEGRGLPGVAYLIAGVLLAVLLVVGNNATLRALTPPP